jgi:hypothetical protein
MKRKKKNLNARQIVENHGNVRMVFTYKETQRGKLIDAKKIVQRALQAWHLDSRSKYRELLRRAEGLALKERKVKQLLLKK